MHFRTDQLVIFCLSCFSLIRSENVLPFRDPRLPLSVRVDDLINRLTTDELIQQVSKGGAGPPHGPAPGIDRLGIDPYQWRTNPADGPGTSFAVPLNQAATFDRKTQRQIAYATGLEMRAKWNEYKREKVYKDGDGINVFAPVANLMRHPLWGRNQETYGEDPYLAGELAKAYVRGVGGWPTEDMDDSTDPLHPHILLVGANCKHFAAHSGPEDYPVSRLSFEAQVLDKDVWLTYLPAFRACLEAGAVGVMCAYSGINGIPDCVNRWLLNTLLRNQWRFKGFVVSDCGALQFLLSEHHFYANNSEAALGAIEAGMNLENSIGSVPNVFSALPSLVNETKVTRDQLIEMVRPLFLSRFLQAEFDPPEADPYRKLAPEKLVQSEAHRRLALVSTARSIVLLTQRDNLLPLRRDVLPGERPLKHLAVVGPFATTVDELFGSYHHKRIKEFEIPLAKGLTQVADKVDAVDICSHGGRCETYDDEALEEILLQETLDLVIVTVGTGDRVEREGLDRHNMSLPGLQREFLLKSLDLAAGRGTFLHESKPVIVLVFSAGPVDIATVLGDENVKAVFWCGFPGPQIGEAMARIILGNSGTSYGPARPLSDMYNEIGEWGSNNAEGYWWIPAGRLPFTWYASIENLANITIYEMTNQTHRYRPRNCQYSESDCSLPVMFPFGYGLTYNRDSKGTVGFVYSDLQKPPGPVGSNQPITISATVSNVGPLASEEVVQFYIQWLSCGPNKTDCYTGGEYEVPHNQLAGFERVQLKVGARKSVQFTLLPDVHLAMWSTRFNMLVPGSGKLRMSVGGQQPYQDTVVGSEVLVGILEVGI
ncbi:unnamed protein product [Calicophoron daubneyi]|uniref:Fibronectin type III-like domain-containing protein n=1 Tax=Calicophoron daubneyi TaxID=300641 RepID=A0AAV2TQS2_CALDB